MTSHCRTNSCLTYLQDITKISLWMSRNIEIGTEQLTLSCGRNWHCGNWLLSVWANSAELTPLCPAASSPRTSARWSSPATPEASTSNMICSDVFLFSMSTFSLWAALAGWCWNSRCCTRTGVAWSWRGRPRWWAGRGRWWWWWWWWPSLSPPPPCQRRDDGGLSPHFAHQSSRIVWSKWIWGNFLYFHGISQVL